MQPRFWVTINVTDLQHNCTVEAGLHIGIYVHTSLWGSPSFAERRGAIIPGPCEEDGSNKPEKKKKNIYARTTDSSVWFAKVMQ